VRQVVTSRYKIDVDEHWQDAPPPPTNDYSWRLVAVVELRRSAEPCPRCGRGSGDPSHIEMLAIWQAEDST